MIKLLNYRYGILLDKRDSGLSPVLTIKMLRELFLSLI